MIIKKIHHRLQKRRTKEWGGYDSTRGERKGTYRGLKKNNNIL
jgi:hypothetical protein